MATSSDQYVIRCDHYDAAGAAMGTTHYGPYNQLVAACDAADWLSQTYTVEPWQLDGTPAHRTNVFVDTLNAPPRHK